VFQSLYVLLLLLPRTSIFQVANVKNAMWAVHQPRWGSFRS